MKKLGLVVLLSVIGLSLIKKRHKHEISTGLASINRAGVNVYSGPTKQAPKIWRLNHKNWAIYITDTSKNWAKIIDAYGTNGWVEKKHIGLAYALVLENTFTQMGKEEIQILKNVCIRFIKEEGSLCTCEINKKKLSIPCKNIWYKL